MSVYYETSRRGWRYDFRYQHQRYKSPRTFATKADAREAEAVLRRRLVRAAAGIEVAPAPASAASFTDWANVYLAWIDQRVKDGRLKRPDVIEHTVRVVLRFWGRRQPGDETPPAKAPCHDLALDDPIRDPSWLRRFDAWMDAAGVANWTKHRYLTTLTRMYWLALTPEYRDAAGVVAYNPFAGRPRPRGRRRTATVSPEQLAAWLGAASYHVRLAMSIAALAPKLRLRNILALEWARDVDLSARQITVREHKTNQHGRALASPISDPLFAILQDARRRHPRSRYVVMYRGGPVKTIDGGVRAAAEAAGLVYGRDQAHGVTFHTLRHSMATLLARLKVHPQAHQETMGHQDYQTTLWYTHLNVDDQREAHDALAAALPIVQVVTTLPRRARRTPPRLTEVPHKGRLNGQGRTAGRLPASNRGNGGGPMATRGLRSGPQTAAERRRKLS